MTRQHHEGRDLTEAWGPPLPERRLVDPHTDVPPELDSRLRK